MQIFESNMCVNVFEIHTLNFIIMLVKHNDSDMTNLSHYFY